MTTYAYIDESGTQPEHKIMSVGVVLFHGRKTAERVHAHVIKDLYPDVAHNPKTISRKKLHFADMPLKVQNTVAARLGKETVRAIINYCWHASQNESHNVIFANYTKMVQSLIYQALSLTTDHLIVIIAQQGGWETYQSSFLNQLRLAADLYIKRNQNIFRKVDYYLKSANTIHGLQLADFYTGAARKMLLDGFNGLDGTLSSPYRHIQHQIILENQIDY